MNAWSKDITAAVLLLITVLIVGLITHLFLPLLFLAFIGVLIRHIMEIDRFEKWIRSGGSGQYPQTTGIWEAIYYHVYRLKKSERKRKKKLGKMVDQFRMSTEALPDAAVVLGAHDEIKWFNKAAMKVLGLKRGDKGQRVPNLIRHPEFTRYLRSTDYQNPVVMPSPTDGNVTLSVRVVTYGAGLRLLLAQDVTQLKKMESMRKDFVANVSHELRTPLTVLKGYLETLTDMDDGESALLSNSVRQMLGQTDRMKHLVDDLLLLTRLETQKKQSHCVNVPALLTKICNEGAVLKNSADRIELQLETQAGILGVEEDLRSAFTNLLVNALKYSPEDAPVSVRWYQVPEGFRLDVTDRGEGIAETDIPRVTERFYRIDVKRNRKVSGTGLGLAIVKHVLHNHTAKLEITSELGKGSCFSCNFPLKLLC
ncbi:MAG: histidine kinase [Gammaproteobacteria bacterium HGW-Gammaproteobacteria-3]|nr:MAG: histidine kinase [Gammaproteobacteria bacterium HGW-Gammaproteobacteria-3]